MSKRFVLVLVCLHLAAAAASARQWTDRSGGYSVEAELVKVEDGRVHLRKPDGQIITVPRDRLSEVDQRYLKSWSPDAREKEPSPAPRKPASGAGANAAANRCSVPCREYACGSMALERNCGGWQLR